MNKVSAKAQTISSLKRARTTQYGCKKCGPRAAVLIQTPVHGNSKNGRRQISRRRCKKRDESKEE